MGQDITKPVEESSTGKLGINVVVSEDSWDPCKSFKLEFPGKDDSYGKPPEGSLTEARAKKACQHINKELSALLCIIREIGTRADNSNNITVTFGKLFRYYIPISDKIVGLLLRARRWRLVDFTGEMLYQGQDDDKVITLLVSEDSIPYSRKYDFTLDSPTQKSKLSHDIDDTANNEMTKLTGMPSAEPLEMLPSNESDCLLQTR